LIENLVERLIERVNEQVDERVNERVNERVDERVNELNFIENQTINCNKFSFCNFNKRVNRFTDQIIKISAR